MKTKRHWHGGPAPRDERERFLEKVSPEPNTGCWLWTSTKGTGGYGAFWFRRRTRLAPRVALLLFRNIDVPRGVSVCHHCDQPACVNPDHLFVGTALDNIRDMELKGRRARGTRIARAKLTDDDVREIRRRTAAGESQERVGRSFGIVQTAVSAIVHRKTWRHVQ